MFKFIARLFRTGCPCYMDTNSDAGLSARVAALEEQCNGLMLLAIKQDEFDSAQTRRIDGVSKRQDFLSHALFQVDNKEEEKWPDLKH